MWHIVAEALLGIGRGMPNLACVFANHKKSGDNV